jgi:propanol-preferring alcohol dehydrogenase
MLKPLGYLKTMTNTMRAMVLDEPGRPLQLQALTVPVPSHQQLLIRVHACGMCRTDLHIVDGELPDPSLPLILGHQIVGEVAATGPDVTGFALGDRVGVPWLGSTCGRCRYCRKEQENLCDEARFTGYHVPGGYADYTVADYRYCFQLPSAHDPERLAPLLCAGLIGYRALKLAGEAERIGLYGFGSAAHILTQVARYQGRQVYAFTRPGDERTQRFARELGARWAGGSDEKPPKPLDAAIIFAPAGQLVPLALRATAKGGTVVCGGIHMSDIPSFPYRDLWEERVLRSVANLTRRDAEEFLSLAPEIPVETHVQAFALEQANEALRFLREGALEGSAVLVTTPEAGSAPR